jgi:predicted Zn-dependent protease
LAAVANRPDFQWNFVVIDDDRQAKAFCPPGGKVAVYTGILPVAQDQAGLAVILGQIAHALTRHGAERMGQGKLAELGGAALAIGLGGSPSSSAMLAAYGLGAQYGVLLPYGRTQGSKADHIGAAARGAGRLRSVRRH